MAEGKADIEKIIQEGHTVQVYPEGYSMYPLLIPGRDEAVIGQVVPRKLRRGAVVLYRRESGPLVLHRVVLVKGDYFFAVGDNQTEIEGPLSLGQIRGVLVAIVRKGRYIPTSNSLYRMLSWFWLFLLPVRGFIIKVAVKLPRFLKKGI